MHISQIAGRFGQNQIANIIIFCDLPHEYSDFHSNKSECKQKPAATFMKQAQSQC